MTRPKGRYSFDALEAEIRNLRRRVKQLAADNKRLSADNRRLRERVQLYKLLFWEPDESYVARPN